MGGANPDQKVPGSNLGRTSGTFNIFSSVPQGEGRDTICILKQATTASSLILSKFTERHQHLLISFEVK